MFCGKCGNVISDGATFCGKCGNRIGQAGNQSFSQPVQRTGTSAGLVIMVIIQLAISAFLAVSPFIDTVRFSVILSKDTSIYDFAETLSTFGRLGSIFGINKYTVYHYIEIIGLVLVAIFLLCSLVMLLLKNSRRSFWIFQRLYIIFLLIVYIANYVGGILTNEKYSANILTFKPMFYVVVGVAVVGFITSIIGKSLHK